MVTIAVSHKMLTKVGNSNTN